jgi:RNA polymerase sigma-70 factor (ECF subfamily)
MERRRETPPTTDCHLVGTVPPDDAPAGTIDFLARCHWKTVYDYLRRRGYDDERAQDLTQGFFQEIVLERDLIGKADPARGPFRAFLLVALCRYLVNVHKRENSCGRIPQSRLTPLDMIEPSRLPQSDPKSTLGDRLDHMWLSEVLTHVLERIQVECQEKGMSVHWHVFREYVVRPIMDHTDRRPLKEVSQRYGVNEIKASNMIVTLKRRFGKLLIQHLRRHMISDETAENDIETVRGFVREIAGRGAVTEGQL